MTSKARASLGFADPLDEFDPAEWSPKIIEPSRKRPPDKAAEQAAQASGFRSREPKAAPGDDSLPPSQKASVTAEATGLRQQRRRRTGRSVQLNLKARPETITAYCEIADRMGWGLGETLEQAVELLRREYGERS